VFERRDLTSAFSLEDGKRFCLGVFAARLCSVGGFPYRVQVVTGGEFLQMQDGRWAHFYPGQFLRCCSCNSILFLVKQVRWGLRQLVREQKVYKMLEVTEVMHSGTACDSGLRTSLNKTGLSSQTTF